MNSKYTFEKDVENQSLLYHGFCDIYNRKPFLIRNNRPKCVKKIGI